jgi:hypothetical protein
MRVGALSSLVMLGTFSLPAILAADSAPIAPRNPGTFDWLQFGHDLRGNAIRRRTAESVSVCHVAAQVARKLDDLQVPPNFDLAGRELGQRMFGPDALYLGNCGHTSDCLYRALVGAGVPQSSLKRIVVLKRRPDGVMQDDLNADHVTLVYLGADGPRTFDVWMASRGRKTFAGFPGSVWNGMSLSEWAQKMRREEYAYAYCREHPEVLETSPELLAEMFRRRLLLVATYGTGQDSASTSNGAM